MPNVIEYEGSHFTIECQVLEDGSSPAKTFLDALDSSERRKLDVLFSMLANRGKISNREKFKQIEGSEKIFEFKSFQIRIFCFFAPGRRVILAFGVRKKRDKLDKADIRRAENYRRAFLEGER